MSAASINITLLLLIASMSCSSLTEKDIAGLWELEELKVDEYKKPHAPTFLEFHPHSSFAASMTSGDLTGTYRLKDNVIDFERFGIGWFQGPWTVSYGGDHMYLWGKGINELNTKLKFRRIDVVPSFEEFEQKMVGQWQLYKRQMEENVEHVNDTWFSIDQGGNYTITAGDNTVETGKAIIDTRHRKVFFLYDQTKWRAWFFGRELRLSNDEMGIKYRLRKTDQSASTTVEQ